MYVIVLYLCSFDLKMYFEHTDNDFNAPSKGKKNKIRDLISMIKRVQISKHFYQYIVQPHSVTYVIYYK